MRLLTLFKSMATKPMQSIGVLSSLGLIGLGSILVILTLLGIPEFVATSLFDTIVTREFFGFFILICGIAYPLSLTRFNPKINKNPLAWAYTGWIFLFLTRILTVGIFPAIWVYPLCLGLITAICHFWDKARE